MALGLPASANGAGAALDIQPVKTFKHLIEIGQASWYGLKFQGRKTATGESYDMNQMTCAHRNLPLGSWVKVTNLKNRKTVVVRVNDRGPALGDRIVDLSYAAAQAVGLRGVGKVRLDTMHPNDPELARALLSQVQMPLPLFPSVVPVPGYTGPAVLSR
jgi:rare lipoprotein A